MADKNIATLRLLWGAGLVAVALSVATCTTGCGSTSQHAAATGAAPSASAATAEAATSPATDATTETATAAEPDPATATNPDGVPIAEALPYEGMPASLIDSTWLGEHDRADEVSESGKYAGATPYRWLAHNGTNDLVYSVYVRDGKVIRAMMSNPDKDYWSVPGEPGYRDLPDLNAAGKHVDRGKLPAQLPDPADYDNPEEFADDAQAYFKERGAKDPYSEAEAYWWNHD